MNILSIGGSEIVVILLVALVLFGSKRIPEIARGLGQGVKEFKKAANEIKNDINESSADIKKDIKDVKDTIEKP